MVATIFYDPAMAEYDFGPRHPLRPQRFTLAVDLMRAYGLFGGDTFGSRPLALTAPSEPARVAELLLVHDADYIEAVRRISEEPERYRFTLLHGIGPGDTPAAPGLHSAASLICGGTIEALRQALTPGEPDRAFAVAGGLHHAHRDRAAGFCVYNDPAVAIASALHERPGLKIAYVDIDAHHGDGVQEAFYASEKVLTISVHETGRHLFPGTGHADEVGVGAGRGLSINVPLPPGADGACYQLVLDEVVEPALAAFAPDAVVVQCGADTHHADPLTHLGLTLPAMRDLYVRIVDLAERHCSGRLVCCGGGGYDTYSAVPRAWTALAATLAGVELPAELPASWRERVAAVSGAPGARTLLEDSPPSTDPHFAHVHTRASVDRVRAVLSSAGHSWARS